LRLSLAGAAILVLAGGTSGVVVAQEEAEAPTDGSALLSFRVPFGGWTTYSKPSVEEGRNTYRDWRRVIDPVETGDPRISGQLWMNQDYDTLHDSRATVAVGHAGIDLDEGAWRGTFSGNGAAGYEGLALIHVDLRGTGAYEGLSAMLFLYFDEASIDHDLGDFDSEGIVFPGELPPMPVPAK
jgi:hypothetical protein